MNTPLDSGVIPYETPLGVAHPGGGDKLTHIARAIKKVIQEKEKLRWDATEDLERAIDELEQAFWQEEDDRG